MVKRERAKLAEPKQSYFTSEKEGLSFIPTGCTLLDCALGGGWCLGRMGNIVGDKSTAKTALATEALTNFVYSFPTGKAAYREIEAAYDQAYAEAMGLPVNKIDFGDPENPLLTVEAFVRDFDKFLNARLKDGEPGIYVVDSLDALSDETEMEQDIGKPSYGTAKAKTLSTFFRTTARKIEKSKVHLLIVSQVRDNIGAMFGEKHKRSGGRAMDFYASQIMWLSHIKMLKRTVQKVERPYGITIKANIKKNKVSLPFRTAEMDFIFGYGIEDLGACLEWLLEVHRQADAGLTQADVKAFLGELDKMSNQEYRKEQKEISAVVKKAWREIETTFLPIRKKYGA